MLAFRAPSTAPEPVAPSAADADVLAAIDRGDLRAALTFLMTRHGDAVFRFCVRTVRDRSTAQDVHQQVFEDAWRDLRAFSRRSPVRTWLFGIALHRCQDA